MCFRENRSTLSRVFRVEPDPLDLGASEDSKAGLRDLEHRGDARLAEAAAQGLVVEPGFAAELAGRREGSDEGVEIVLADEAGAAASALFLADGQVRLAECAVHERELGGVREAQPVEDGAQPERPVRRDFRSGQGRDRDPQRREAGLAGDPHRAGGLPLEDPAPELRQFRGD